VLFERLQDPDLRNAARPTATEDESNARMLKQAKRDEVWYPFLVGAKLRPDD
jgi:hypothetical protein